MKTNICERCFEACKRVNNGKGPNCVITKGYNRLERFMTDPILYRFTQRLNLTGAIIVGTGNIISFTPTCPFKLSNILIWYSKPIIIQQIKIGNINQLIYPVYDQQLTAPDTLEVVEKWYKNGILYRMLRENNAYHLDFIVADREHPMTIEFEGSFDVMALYGAELR